MEPVLTDTAWKWMNDIFAAKAAQRGGIVRRSVRDIEREVGRDVFLAEVRRRGYALVENGGQWIVFCNNETIRRLA